ncbi:cbb3-type cytochrome c oxidase N-terminal domain-containing protein [Salegentibacter sp. HM20]
MKNIAALLRISGFLLLAYLLIQITSTGASDNFEGSSIFWLIMGIALLLALAVEAFFAAFHNIIERSLSAEAKQRFSQIQQRDKAKRFGWLKRWYAKMLNQKPLEQEDEIVLDHNYDGIRELDNDLPSWWLYGFYATIIFAVIYMARFHVFNDYTQEEEYLAELAKAQEEVEAWKLANPGAIDASNVELLTDAASLEKGEGLYMTNCMACHRADGGGGIGPNLTDEHWILGGGISNIFNTVSEGGRDGKGMVAWKSSLTPEEIAQVSSYVISLQGTNPEDAKAPEGDIWTQE